MTATNEQNQAALTLVKILLEAIRDAGPMGIAQGPIYAMLMGKMNLDQFNGLMRVIRRTGLVEFHNSGLMTWIGPAIEKELKKEGSK